MAQMKNLPLLSFSVMKWNTEAGSHLFINIISSSFEDSSRV